MDEQGIQDLPKDIRSIDANLLGGLLISERVIEATILVETQPNGYAAILCGTRFISGEKIFLRAQSLQHNWVLDDTTLRPLPMDISESIELLFSQFDLSDLRFKDVLAIDRLEQDLIQVELSNDVFSPALQQASKIGNDRKIPGLQAELFPYQADGVEWMSSIISHTGGLILADEMGLGKTIQIISLLLITPPIEESPALIICPTSLISNWRNEIFRFAPELSVLVHRGAQRAGLVRDIQIAQVVITTYDTAVNDISMMSNLEWSWVICDEAQAIKNPLSARRKNLALLPRIRSIPMTGTPVENSLRDLWSLADFAIPGLLGTIDEFETMYPDSLESAEELTKVTGPVVLRRKVEDVAGDPPDRIDIDLPIPLTDELADEYEKVRQETLEEYGIAGALVATGRLQMFCAHPWLQHYKADSPFWEEEAKLSRSNTSELITPKIERTISLILESFANNRKVLVFSVFNRCADLIEEALGRVDSLYWNTINGSTHQEDRQSIIDKYTEHTGNACLVLNPKAAGAGLNITAATVVIHFTQVWNPALEAQASARAHRRGQDKPVNIYRLFYENTVEEVMMERSQWKRQLGNDAVPITTREGTDLKRALEISPRGVS